MNADLYALGPGNHANVTIGRALWLFILNLGGGQVGVNIMGVQGNPSLFSFCFAENEEASPWKPYSVEKGFNPGESVLTLFSGGWCHVGNYISHPLIDLAKDAAVWEFPDGLVALLSPPRAKDLLKEGHSKESVKEFIWKNATLPMKEVRSNPYYKIFMEPVMKGRPYFGEKYVWPKEYLEKLDEDVVPVFPRNHVEVIVVGGEISPMMQGWHMAFPKSVSIDKWR